MQRWPQRLLLQTAGKGCRGCAVTPLEGGAESISAPLKLSQVLLMPVELQHQNAEGFFLFFFFKNVFTNLYSGPIRGL